MREAQVTDLGLNRGASDGNRTRALSLGSSCSTIKLHSHTAITELCIVGYSTSFSDPGRVASRGPLPDRDGVRAMRRELRVRASRSAGWRGC